MKSFVVIVFLFGITLSALAQPHASDPAYASPSAAPDALPPSVVLRASERATHETPDTNPALSVSHHLQDWKAPSATEEFPATVFPFGEPSYLGTSRVQPSSFGGWMVQILARLVCNAALDDFSSRTTRCDYIGKRTYGYPRFE